MSIFVMLYVMGMCLNMRVQMKEETKSLKSRVSVLEENVRPSKEEA